MRLTDFIPSSFSSFAARLAFAGDYTAFKISSIKTFFNNQETEIPNFGEEISWDGIEQWQALAIIADLEDEYKTAFQDYIRWSNQPREETAIQGQDEIASEIKTLIESTKRLLPGKFLEFVETQSGTAKMQEACAYYQTQIQEDKNYHELFEQVFKKEALYSAAAVYEDLIETETAKKRFENYRGLVSNLIFEQWRQWLNQQLDEQTSLEEMAIAITEKYQELFLNNSEKVSEQSSATSNSTNYSQAVSQSPFFHLGTSIRKHPFLSVLGLSAFGGIASAVEVPLGTPGKLNSQAFPIVSTLPNGNIVAAWQGLLTTNDIYAQVFNGINLAPLTSDFQINSITRGEQLHPALAPTKNGIMFCWDSDQAGPVGEFDVNCREVQSTLEPILTPPSEGDEFIMSGVPNVGSQRFPKMASIPGVGDTVNHIEVIFSQEGNVPHFVQGHHMEDFPFTELRTQDQILSAATGAFTADEADLSITRFAVNSNQTLFATAWRSFVEGKGQIFTRLLERDTGIPIGPAAAVSYNPKADQSFPYVFNLPQGFAVTWSELSPVNSTNNGEQQYAVKYRRFDTEGRPQIEAIQVIPAVSKHSMLRPRGIGLPGTDTFLIAEDLERETSKVSIVGVRCDTNGKPVIQVAKISEGPTTYAHPEITQSPEGKVVAVYDRFDDQGLRSQSVMKVIPLGLRVTANTLTIIQGQTLKLSLENLNADGLGINNANLVFIVTEIQHGNFRFVSEDEAITTFKVSDVQQGRVQFQHDGSEQAPSYKMSVSNGEETSAPESANIVFIAIGPSNSNIEVVTKWGGAILGSFLLVGSIFSIIYCQKKRLKDKENEKRLTTGYEFPWELQKYLKLANVGTLDAPTWASFAGAINRLKTEPLEIITNNPKNFPTLFKAIDQVFTTHGVIIITGSSFSLFNRKREFSKEVFDKEFDKIVNDIGEKYAELLEERVAKQKSPNNNANLEEVKILISPHNITLNS